MTWMFARSPRSVSAPAPFGDSPFGRILLIEDDLADAVLVRELLRDAGLVHELVCVDSLGAGLGRLEQESFTVVLSDLGLPDSRGLDTFRRIRAAAGITPVVVLSGLDDEVVSAEAVREGAQDYLIKGRIESSSLQRALRYAVERSRAAERLHQSETLLSVAEEIAHLGSWEWDIGAGVLRWSDELYRIYGLRRSEFDATWDGYLARVHPEDRERVRGAIAKALASGEGFEFEERIVRPDGTLRVLHSEGRAIVDAAGRMLRLAGACQDVTERRRAESALAATARQQSAVAELGRRALAGLDIETLKKAIIRQVAQTLHVETCEIIEFPTTPLADGAQPSGPVEGFNPGGGISVLIPGKDRLYGTLGVRSPARRQFPRDDVSFLQSVANILAEAIERKRVEDELRQARDEAVRAARLKSAFLANMSHEIRTPINVILGYNGILSDASAELDEPARRIMFEGVRNAGLRLTSTIDGILDLSKIETRNFEVHPQEIELGPFLEGRSRELAVQARAKGLAVSCTVLETAARIRFDEYCLARALHNLLQNALKFTESGTITVTLDRDPQGCLRISVADTGIGVEASYLPRLFDRFSQEEGGYHRRFEGSGLGLALAKEYLELNGASIDAQSEKGRGMHLRIRFPRDCEPSAASCSGEAVVKPVRFVAAGDGQGSARTARLRVLVVEDDLSNQVYMRRILEDRCDVRFAAGGAQVRDELKAGEVDLILMDLSLGGARDGLAITRELRRHRRWRDVAIVATTAHAFPEDRERALTAGCTEYIAKPFRPGELLRLIGKVMHREI